MNNIFKFAPNDNDYINSTKNSIISLKYIRDMFIDCEKGHIEYNVWVNTVDIFKLPSPEGAGNNAIYTHEFEMNYNTLINLKGDTFSCEVVKSSYYQNKHIYCIQIKLKVDSSDLSYKLPPDLEADDINLDFS